MTAATRLCIFFCLVGYISATLYFPKSCSRCSSTDFIPKLPVSSGPVDSGSNRPYAWAIEAMIQTKLNFDIVSPPSAGRICGIVGTCLYEAAALNRRDMISSVKPSAKLPAGKINDDTLTDAIDGAGFWAVYRLFGDTASFNIVYDHYDAFSGKDIRGLLPAMKKATKLPLSALVKRLFTKPLKRADVVAAGAAACERVIKKYTSDGFTPLGRLRGFNPSSYSPRNSPQRLGGVTHCDELEAFGRWQPLCIPNAQDSYGTEDCTPQQFIFDWAGRFSTFALRRGTERSGRGLVPSPPRVGSSAFRKQAEQVLQISGKLGDREKVLAEYWADGPDSTMPAGHLWKIAADAGLAEGLSQVETAKLLFITGVALNDAGVASWRTKTSFDFTRPLQMIQCGHLRGKTRKAWLGPYQGVGPKNVSEWRPYQASTFVSPGFAAYTSGHSTFSAAGAEAMKLYFGDDKYRGPDCDIVKQGESLFEPKSDAKPGFSDIPNTGPATIGYVPAEDVVFCWDTWTQTSLQSGRSRLYGGIHISADDTAGQTLGRRIARSAYIKARVLFRK